MKLMLLAASLRKDSCNKKLIRFVNKILLEKNFQPKLFDFRDFELPIYDDDVKQQYGIHENAKKFIAEMFAHDAVIISSPEYNFSMPGTLKNLIDWVSRQEPMPFRKRKFLLMSASPSLVGGNRGLWATRVPLECCGAIVYPDMFSLASAYDAFQENGDLKDEKLQNRLQKNLMEFCEFVGTDIGFPPSRE